jgi:hypothetical protein
MEGGVATTVLTKEVLPTKMTLLITEAIVWNQSATPTGVGAEP